MCFKVSLLLSTSYVFTLYRPQNDGVSIFESISEKIDTILLSQPSASIHICGDFNIHHKEWLIHSNTTDFEGRYCHNFALAYELSQIIDGPTRVPDVTGHTPSLLDLFLTSSPNTCTHSICSPLGSSDHCLIEVNIESKCVQTNDVPFHRRVFRYSKADWNGFRNFISDIPLTFIFSHGPSKSASLLSDWVSTGMECFIPSKVFQLKPNSHPWFTPECAAAIAHRNHFFHLYQKNRRVDTQAKFRTTRNHCKRVIRNPQSGYAKSIRDQVRNQKIGSRQFRKITNKVLNQGKSSIPNLLVDNSIVTSSADKANIFASLFAKNSTLDDLGQSPPDFPLVTSTKLENFKVTAKEVSKLIKELDSSKATGPDGIPVIVLKHLSPELSPILAKLFNNCLKGKTFPSIWKTSMVCPVFKNSVPSYQSLEYYQQIF